MISPSQRGRINTKRGAGGELVALHLLRHLGILCLARHETGWRVKRVGKRIVGATPLAKVPGDYVGVLPGGRAVIVEVKVRPERLSLCDLDRHQIAALNEHHAAGAVALLVWCWTGGAAVMRWPVLGLEPGKGISIAQAQGLALVPGFWKGER